MPDTWRNGRGRWSWQHPPSVSPNLIWLFPNFLINETSVPYVQAKVPHKRYTREGRGDMDSLRSKRDWPKEVTVGNPQEADERERYQTGYNSSNVFTTYGRIVSWRHAAGSLPPTLATPWYTIPLRGGTHTTHYTFLRKNHHWCQCILRRHLGCNWLFSSPPRSPVIWLEKEYSDSIFGHWSEIRLFKDNNPY